MRKKKKTILKIVIALAALAVAALAAVLIINGVVTGDAQAYIYDPEQVDGLQPADCVLVLGARVYDDERLSPILQDRVDVAIDIYFAGKAGALLFSGDHGQKDYDEVNAMMEYAAAKGVPRQDIFLDHAGFCTYDSMYRARDVFCVKSAIIVTQQFHISRAVYIARRLGLDAVGVHSDPRAYANAAADAVRESFARVKDFFTVNVFMPGPKYLGEKIPISGDSTATHDKD